MLKRKNNLFIISLEDNIQDIDEDYIINTFSKEFTKKHKTDLFS